jgi:predicted nuclease with TOPRIM domain
MLEAKYQQLQEDQFRSEREGRQRAEQDLKTITNLRDEIDLLKHELVSRNREVQEFRCDNSALQEMVHFRTNELAKVRSEVAELQE